MSFPWKIIIYKNSMSIPIFYLPDSPERGIQGNSSVQIRLRRKIAFDFFGGK
jgi:hypothetical protein